MKNALLDRPTVIDPLTTDPACIDSDLLCWFLGRWTGLLSLAADEAIRRGKTPEEAGEALAFVVQAHMDGVTNAN